MASFRRSMSVMQRDGAAQNGEVSFDISSPPNLPHNPAYLAAAKLMNSFPNSLNLPGIILQRTRSVERSKPRGLYVKRSFLHFFVCFMIGGFISFAPLVSVHISTNFTSKQHVFSFKEGTLVDDARKRIGSVENDNLLLEKPPAKNRSFGRLAELKVSNEAVDASRVIPVSRVNSAYEDWELVPQKLLIIVTPTHERPYQAYYLNRLAHTLRVIPPPVLWIVVEMSSQSAETAKILRDTGVMHRHLVCNENVTSIRNKEVSQRNVALSHIEKHRLDGVVHFADDDRMYSVEVFDKMRLISRFGSWPVAVLSENKNKVLLEGPVCNGSEVIGWHTNQRNKLARRFHLDMSGFAFNSTILWDPKRWHRPTLEPIRQHDRVKEGYQETTFVEQVVEDESQMDGFPSDCSRVMVWHLHLESPELLHPKGWLLNKNLEVVVPLS